MKRKQVYRVVTEDRILSQHKTYAAAFAAEGAAQAYAAMDILGLKPGTLIHIERWSDRTGTWQRCN